jgi:hypothetical protein
LTIRLIDRSRRSCLRLQLLACIHPTSRGSRTGQKPAKSHRSKGAISRTDCPDGPLMRHQESRERTHLPDWQSIRREPGTEKSSEPTQRLLEVSPFAPPIEPPRDEVRIGYQARSGRQNWPPGAAWRRKPADGRRSREADGSSRSPVIRGSFAVSSVLAPVPIARQPGRIDRT